MTPPTQRPWFELDAPQRMRRWRGVAIEVALSLGFVGVIALAVALVLGWRPW